MVTFAIGLLHLTAIFDFLAFIDGIMGLSPNLVGVLSVMFPIGLSTFGRHFEFLGFLLMASWDFHQTWWEMSSDILITWLGHNRLLIRKSDSTG